MEASIKKKIFLEDLHCQLCVQNIATLSRKQKRIKSDFDSKKKVLNVQYDDQKDYTSFSNKIQSILSEHEHHLSVKESEASFLKEYRLGKLHGDIRGMEAKIMGLPGVKKAVIEKQRLRLESDTPDQETLIRQIRKYLQGLEILDDEEASRFEIFALILSLLLFIGGLVLNLNPKWEFALFFLAYLLSGYKVIIASLKAILQGRIFDETFLMSIATVGAFIIGEYPEGVAVMLFYRVGEMLQEAALEKARRSITQLMDLRPDYANLLVAGEQVRTAPEAVPVGALLLIQPGERIPLDGIVVEGTSALDVSALTGESDYQNIEPGSKVLSGSINTSQVFTVRVEKTYEDSTANKILELVETSASRKTPTERFMTKLSRYYTPAVVGGALVLALLVPLLTGSDFSAWIYRALIFLVISCPCALVISIPLGFFGGVGNASRNGILIKGSNYLDALNSVKTFVFDKTGTLTEGKFNVKEIIPGPGYSKEEVLHFALIAESHSHHPLARSLTEAYGNQAKTEITSYQELPGLGIKVQTAVDTILAGDVRLLRKEGIVFSEIPSIGTILYLALNGIYLGAIVLADQIKAGADEVIRDLKNLGIKETVLLSGDKREIVEAVGQELGIDQVYSQLLPADKVREMEDLKTRSGKIAYVGDGINDAPVLALADLGIAMGGLGSDAAIEASDIVIMKDDLNKLPVMLKIARRTRRIVWQNIIFALMVKFLFLGLGAFGIAGMWDAVFADVGVSLLAIINALRIMKSK